MKTATYLLVILATVFSGHAFAGYPYTIVGTGQTTFYGNSAAISSPSPGQSFYGQDAQYTGNAPSYTASDDGLTVYDNNTGLTWTQSPDLDEDGDYNHTFPPGDHTKNCYVDLNDFPGVTIETLTEFAKNWLICTSPDAPCSHNTL